MSRDAGSVATDDHQRATPARRHHPRQCAADVEDAIGVDGKCAAPFRIGGSGDGGGGQHPGTDDRDDGRQPEKDDRHRESNAQAPNRGTRGDAPEK